MEWGGDFLFTKTWDFNFHPSGEILFYILDILKKAYIEAKKKKKRCCLWTELELRLNHHSNASSRK